MTTTDRRHTAADNTLTPAERAALIAEYLAAGSGSATALLRHKWPALAGVADRLHSPDDTEAAALRGLVIASRKFDPARGVKFVSYAATWVRAVVGRMVKRDTLDWEHRGRRGLVSGDTPAGDEKDGRVFDLLADRDRRSADEAHRHWLGEQVRLAVKRCVPCPHKRAVFRLRWGLDGGPAMRLREVAALFATSRERVRQIDDEVRTRLWRHLRAVAA